MQMRITAKKQEIHTDNPKGVDDLIDTMTMTTQSPTTGAALLEGLTIDNFIACYQIGT